MTFFEWFQQASWTDVLMVLSAVASIALFSYVAGNSAR